ncbi:MAG TPA: class I SAM-dependent methyltransferase [Acidimicrobiia bacterium]|nr:class I SAM-dependent methyltransferase [Acidimicrobiia bacterium]
MDAEGWNARYATSELIWKAEPNAFVAAEAADLPPGRALDLACGEGRNAIWLASRGWRAVGVDFATAGLDKARSLAQARGVEVEWVLADVTTYRPVAGSFDLVVLAYLHLPAPQMAVVLRHATRALAPGGTLVVVGHDITNPTDGYGGPQDPAVLYGPDDVVREIAGLTVEKAERVTRAVATDDGTKHAIDVLVRAHA